MKKILVSVFSMTAAFAIGGIFAFAKPGSKEGDFPPDSTTQTAVEGYWTDYAEAFSGGNGTEEDPYLISSAGQLANVGVYEGDTMNHFTYYELTSDIDLSAHYWIPIGNVRLPFIGNFNGNGHKISGMTCRMQSAEDEKYATYSSNIYCMGLFGIVRSFSVYAHWYSS